MYSSVISHIHAIEVLDSQGNPTLSVEVTLKDGSIGLSEVPAGGSPGEFESAEIRDGDRGRYRGRGVLTAVANINSIIRPVLCGSDACNQSKIDAALVELDATNNRSRLGANAILGVSLAVARAAAISQKLELYEYLAPNTRKSLPVPIVNMINGGVHADSNLDIEGIMIVPHGAPSFREAVRMSSEIYHALGALLRDDGYYTGAGDEGGYATRFEGMEMAFDLVMRAIEKADYIAGEDVSLAFDIAASELAECEGEEVIYRFCRSSGRKYSASELISAYEEWIRHYPIFSIEDGLGENDWEGWQELTARLGNKVQLVGDDLFVTNPSRIAQGIELRLANAVLIKMNQIGTLSETLEAINLAQGANYKTIVSHRSGDTCDAIIADLAVASGADQIKMGAVCRGERIAKFNRLLWIEDKLGGQGLFRSPSNSRGK